MTSYAKWLFGIAAAFNIVVGGAMVFAKPLIGPPLGLVVAPGTNLAIINLAGMLVAAFGILYGMIGADPVRYRPFIALGAAGKLAAFIIVLMPYLAGRVPAALPGLVAGDVVFAILFLDFLRRTRAPAPA